MTGLNKDYSDLGPIPRLSLPQIRAHVILSLIHLPGCQQIIPDDPIAAEFVAAAGLRYKVVVHIRLHAGAIELDIDLEHDADLPDGEPEKLRMAFISELIRRTKGESAHFGP